jgi:thiol-disulfide isomerase/thioredoxin
MVAGAPISSLRAQAQPAPANTRSESAHSVSEILQSAIKALAPLKSVEYEVRAIPADPATQASPVFTGRAVVLATIGSPIRYRARFQSEGSSAVELAVSDGEKVRISAGGQLSEYPTRAMMDSASAVALPTLPAFDPDTYRKALASQTALYAGQDDIEGDLCYVVAAPSLFPEEIGSDTSYYWISARTGLPRSKQTYRILHGKTLLTYRWIISNIRMNPPIPADAFAYHPTVADSVASTAAAGVAKPSGAIAMEPTPEASLVGKQVPELEARDTDYEPVPLARITKGKATILTLWATWCAPCVAELPTFQELVDRHPGELQVVAVAIQDARLNVLSFIKKHPEYKFIFLTDPDLEDSNSAISRFFVGEGVPRSALIDPKGVIVEYHLGSFENKADELKEKVDKWITQLKTAR